MDNIAEKIDTTSDDKEEQVIESIEETNIETDSDDSNEESILDDSKLQELEDGILNRLSEEKRNKIDREQLGFEKEMFSQMQEYAQLAGLVKKYKSGENINYYEAMPETMKEAVQTMVILHNQDHKKQLSKNQMAKKFIQDMVEEYERDNEREFPLETLEEELQKFRTDRNSEVIQMFMESDEAKRKSLHQAIEESKDDPEKLSKAQNMLDCLDESYNLTKFMQFCSTCKIKNFDVRKPKRFFNQFIGKYSNSKNEIGDILRCPDILMIHLPNIEPRDAIMVLVAFCKYTASMDPNDILDHMFMYHFIRHIILLDLINPGNSNRDNIDEKMAKLYNGFIANLITCIEHLRERNPVFHDSKE